MTELHWTEIDGVATVWVDAPLPLRGGLLFRTGRIDETLSTAGQTHLIEHLALSALGDISKQNNGIVSGSMTGFFTMGNPKEVTRFFAEICEALTSLPGQYLERERQVLAAENAARQYDFRTNLLMWRYGTAGYGLPGMPELGLRKAALDQLRTFAGPRFASENAILWLSGPPPADLHLHLPHGTKQPIPALSPIKLPYPSWYVDDSCGGIAAGSIVPRVSASSLFCEIATRRLQKRLRTERAVSYSPTVYYEHLNADTAHLILYADSDKDHRTELTQAFGEVFQEFGDIDQEECDAVRKQISEYWTGSLSPSSADQLGMEVQRAAMDWIFGREHESIDKLQSELLDVTLHDVQAFVRDVQKTALFALPGGVNLHPCFGKAAPHSIDPVVKGPDVFSIDAPIRKERLVYGSEGVSVRLPNGSHLTVLYSNLAAALYYDDGCLRLIGSDAASILLEPTLWRNGRNVVRTIREQIPQHLLIEQGARPENMIPKPATTAWQRFYAWLIQR